MALVYPPYHFKPPVWPFSRPTLVLAHLYAILEKAGVRHLEAIDLDLEFDHSGEGVDNFLAKAEELVGESEPDVICLSCKAAQFPFSTLFSRMYKRSHPETKIVMGGWMPTLAPEQTLRLSGCDAVVRGEGERVLPRLIQEIDNEEWSIEGVSYMLKRGGKEVIHNPNQRPLSQEELDSLPLPRYDALPPLERYEPGQVKHCFSVQASRGCPNHSCVFCWNSTKNCATTWRARSPKRVVEEIRSLVNEYGAQVIFFTDDSFGAEAEWLKRFTSLMKAEFKLGEFEYIASMRVDSVDVRMLHDLYESGMRTIFHGIESGSPRCWKTLGKNLNPQVTREYILDLVEREVENRISPICSFIVAFPRETEEDLDQTISLCEELADRGSLFSLQILAPNEGTALYESHIDLIEPRDVYKEFGESENLSPELRTVFGDALNSFADHLPDFRIVRPSMPIERLKTKYALLGDICSYEGLIQRRFKVHTITQDGRYIEPAQRGGGRTTSLFSRLLRRFRQL